MHAVFCDALTSTLLQNSSVINRSVQSLSHHITIRTSAAVFEKKEHNYKTSYRFKFYACILRIQLLYVSMWS